MKAARLLEIINERFLSFQDDDVLSQLQGMISFDPPQGISVTALIPKMESRRITGTRQSVILPGSLTLKLNLSFEANHGQVQEEVRFLSRGSGFATVRQMSTNIPGVTR